MRSGALPTLASGLGPAPSWSPQKGNPAAAHQPPGTLPFPGLCLVLTSRRRRRRQHAPRADDAGDGAARHPARHRCRRPPAGSGSPLPPVPLSAGGRRYRLRGWAAPVQAGSGRRGQDPSGESPHQWEKSPAAGGARRGGSPHPQDWATTRHWSGHRWWAARGPLAPGAPSWPAACQGRAGAAGGVPSAPAVVADLPAPPVGAGRRATESATSRPSRNHVGTGCVAREAGTTADARGGTAVAGSAPGRVACGGSLLGGWPLGTGSGRVGVWGSLWSSSRWHSFLIDVHDWEPPSGQLGYLLSATVPQHIGRWSLRKRATSLTLSAVRTASTSTMPNQHPEDARPVSPSSPAPQPLPYPPPVSRTQKSPAPVTAARPEYLPLKTVELLITCTGSALTSNTARCSGASANSSLAAFLTVGAPRPQWWEHDARAPSSSVRCVCHKGLRR